MPYVIGALFLIAAAGFAAGFLLAPAPIAILAALAIFWTIIMYSGTRGPHHGTSAGIAPGILSLLGPFFLLFLAIGALVGYGGCTAIVEYDWSSLGGSVSEFMLRQ